MLEEPLKAKFKYLLFFGFIEDRTGFLKMVYPSGRKSGQKKNLWIFIFIWKEHKCCKSGNAAIDIGLST